jgi:hypothetical protein
MYTRKESLNVKVYVPDMHYEGEVLSDDESICEKCCIKRVC